MAKSNENPATETTANQTENAAPANKPISAEGTKFPLERLRQDCLKLFGVTTSTFDGATFGKTEKYTVDEVKKFIEAWQKTPIKFKKEGN